MADFVLRSEFVPAGDQPEAIRQIVEGLGEGDKFQTLLGVTGSGKTFTMANIIAKVQRPALIISHNKTLAAQLYGEFRTLFPENAVEYFISYYDYYQPEAYLPVTDTYIEKDSSVNEEIDKLRLRTTSSLLSRRDVVVVASVSCIYGIGSPDEYREQTIRLACGEAISRRSLFEDLVNMHYVRSDALLERGRFRARGDVIDIWPAYEDAFLRIELAGNTVLAMAERHPITMVKGSSHQEKLIFPAKHFVTDPSRMAGIVAAIEDELEQRLAEFRRSEKLLEAQRLEQRTRFDLEMMQEVGYCSGIENYSRFFSGRQPGEKPWTLLDFFLKDALVFVDESHVTLPQIRGMFAGDHRRKEVLVEYGFRLPSALDNRPLTFQEFEESVGQVVYASATPTEFEYERSNGVVVEQIVRPTGLLDPEIDVRPTKGQIDDLIAEIKRRTARKERALVTTLTKRMAEDLADFLKGTNLKVRYLHSEIEALERIRILRDLRLGTFDVLVGINLLREGLDLPEVSLVAVLDADKEGFLRSESSLMQVAGRASRNVNGMVIFYADRITGSMGAVINESRRRRDRQAEYNRTHGIVPKSVAVSMDKVRATATLAGETPIKGLTSKFSRQNETMFDEDKSLLEMMRKEMFQAAENLEFEKAAHLRDEISRLNQEMAAAPL